MQARSFDEIKNFYTKAQAAGLDSAKGSLADYSNYMQSIMPNEDWSAGQQPDNFVGAFSRGVDSLLEDTGLPYYTGKAGATVGSGFDTLLGENGRYEKLGQSVGEGIPRGLVDTGLIMGGSALSATGVGSPLGVAMIGAGMADAGIKAYADTGSVGAGVANAALMGLAPGIGSVGSKLALGALPKSAIGNAGLKAATSVLGSEAAMAGAGMLTAPFSGEDILSGENIVGNILGSVIFAPMAVKQGFETHSQIKARTKSFANSTDPITTATTESVKLSASDDFSFTGTHMFSDGGDLFDSLVGMKSTDVLPAAGQHIVRLVKSDSPWNKTPEEAQAYLEKLANTDSNGVDQTVLIMDALNRFAAKYDAAQVRRENTAVQAGKANRLFNARHGLFPLMGEAGFLDSSNPRLFENTGESVLEPGAPAPKRETIYFDPIEVSGNKVRPKAVEDPRLVKVPGRITLDPLDSAPETGLKVKPLGEVATDADIGGKRGSWTLEQLQEARGTVQSWLAGRSRVAKVPSWQREQMLETGGRAKVSDGVPKEVTSALKTLAESGEPFQLEIEKPKSQSKESVLTPEEQAAWEQEQREQFGGTMREETKPKVRKPKAVKTPEPSGANPDRLKLLREVGKKLGFRVLGGEEPDLESEVFRFVKGPIRLTEDGKFSVLGTSDVPKSGLVHEGRFAKATQMPKEVFELVKKVYPEAWEGENVNVNRLRELEKTRPLLEAHVYGQDGKGGAKTKLDQLRGELDILGIHAEMEGDSVTFTHQGREVFFNDPDLPPSTIAKMEALNEAFYGDLESDSGPRATSYYNTISPFDTTKYPVVRIDVTIPKQKPGLHFDENKKVVEKESTLWRQDDLHENLPNTLGWAMVQFVPDPRTGETVMFVAEQQSRWGQERNRYSIKPNRNVFEVWYRPTEGEPYRIINAKDKAEAQNYIDGRTPSHELLDIQHKLVLKRAMDEARKRGVTKMVVSDGETAMMTEKHDVQSPNEGTILPSRNNVEKAKELLDKSKTGQLEGYLDSNDFADLQKLVNGQEVLLTGPRWFESGLRGENFEMALGQPSQAGGMRQHYDKLLQTTATKLTGDIGLPWEGPVHKNAKQVEWDMDSMIAGRPDTVTYGSPVFRNPDGTPKANITGRIYDLSQRSPGEVRYMQRNVAQNPDGTYTAASVRNAFEILLPQNEGQPMFAQERISNMAKMDLQTKVEDAAGKHPYVEQSKRVLSDIFRKLGLPASVEEHYLGMAEKVLSNLPQLPGTETRHMMSNTMIEAARRDHGENIVKALSEGVEGLALPPTSKRDVLLGISGLRSKLMPENSPEGQAFVKVHTMTHEAIHGTIMEAEASIGVDSNLISSRQRAVMDSLDYVNKLTHEQRIALLSDLTQFTVSHFKNSAARDAYVKDAISYGGSKPIETLTEYAAQLAMHLYAEPGKGAGRLQAYVRHLPEPIQRFIKSVYSTISDLAHIVIGGAKARGMDDVQVRELEQFHQNVLEFIKPDPVVVAAESKLMNATQAPRAIENGNLGGIGVQYKKTGSGVTNKYVQNLEGELKQSNWFVRNFAQHQQISNTQKYLQAIPQYAKVVSAVARLDNTAVRLQHQIRSAFMVQTDGGFMSNLFTTRDGKLNPAQRSAKMNMQTVAGNRELHLAVNDAMRISNDIVAEVALTGEAYPDFNHPRIQERFAKFRPEQVAAAKVVFEAYANSNRTAGKLHMRMAEAQMAKVMSHYLLGGGMEHEKAGRLGKELMNGLVFDKMAETVKKAPELGSIDPTTLQFVPASESVAKAVKHWENVKERYEKTVSEFDRPYFNEMRSGRWLIRYDSGKVDADGQPIHGTRSTDSPWERDVIIRDLKKQGLELIGKPIDRRGRDQTDFGRMQVNGLDEMAFLVQQHYDAFLANLEPAAAQQVKETMAGFDVAEPITSEVANRKTYLNKRTFAPGREYLDMIAAQDAYSSLIARKVANFLTRLDTNWEMQHPNWSKDAKLREEVQTFKNNVLSQGRQEFKPFRKMVTFLTLGANVSSAIVDATQPGTMGVWRLAEEVGPVKALKMVSRAYLEAFKPFDKMDKTYRDLLVRATNEGLLKTGGQLDDLITLDEHANFNVIQAGRSRDMVDFEKLATNKEFLASKAFDMFNRLGNKTLDVSMMAHRLSSQINNRVMLWGGLEAARQKGLTGAQAENYAINMMMVTNVGGGRAAHSSFKMKAGMFNGVVEAATLMTNYPIAAMSQMYGAWSSGLKSSGLSAEAQSRSRKAFAGQLLTQFALAGSLGLGLDALFRVSKDWFGIDPEDAIREGLATIDDSGALADSILHGVASDATGVDLASRYSLTGIAGLNSYTGFEPRGIFGAGGSVLSALYNAPSQIAAGEPSKINLLPVGVRRMIGGLTGQGTVDQSGQRIIEPTSAETMMQMVGFKPNRLTKMQNMRSRMKAVDEGVTQKTSQQKREMVNELMKGNVPAVMEQLQQQINEESVYLLERGMDPAQLKRQQQQMLRTKILELADFATEKTLPYDPMDGGSRASAPQREQLARAYGVGMPRASEVQREILRQRVAESMGVRPTLRPKAIREAQKTEAVRTANPYLPRSVAKEIAK